MTDTYVSQGSLLAVGVLGETVPWISQGTVFAAANFPAEFTQVAQAAIVTAGPSKLTAEVAQATVYAIARGRVANPRARAWTFTLDGHDFYVLRLGDRETLIYDVYSEQWVEWTSSDLPFWRPSSGMNWSGAEILADEFGSNIVAGDDTFGLLWFLDPEQAFDDHPDYQRLPQQMAFPRIITAQVLATGREFIPCYAVFLTGDNYGLSGVDFTPEIVLETSDDQGRTFEVHDTLTVTPDYDQNLPYEWLSLGQISTPGRIFRFTDNGVFARIDSLDMNDDGG